MNEEKEKEEAENAEKAKEEESCLEKAREKEKEEARAKEAEEAEEKVEQENTEQQMSDKRTDEKDEDVEVCVRQVIQIPQADRRYWVKLLLPLMTQRARTVINRVTLVDRDNYATVKEHLLKEFKLTPREYRSKFMDAKKTAEETYTMFTARLKNLLNYYVKSRQVNDDYERIFDLFVSDKLKESLPPGPLQFVLSKEGTECSKASMIADLADIHTNNKIGMPSYSKQSYGSTVSYKKNSSGNGFRFPDKKYQGSSDYNRQSQSERNNPERKLNENQDQKQVGWRTPKNKRFTESSTPRGFGNAYTRTTDDVKRCHHCNSDKHLVRDCEQAKGNQNTQEKRADFRTMRINSVHLQPARENLDSQETHQTLKVNDVKSDPIWLDFYGNQFDPYNPTANQIQVRPTGKVNEETKTKLVMKCGVNLKPNHQEIMPEQIVVKRSEE